eukprot:COSAG03_NODE_183_length_10952_cov_150.888694_9_plen_90_part_00
MPSRFATRAKRRNVSICSVGTQTRGLGPYTAGCPAWLLPALRPEAAAVTHEWTAAPTHPLALAVLPEFLYSRATGIRRSHRSLAFAPRG